MTGYAAAFDTACGGDGTCTDPGSPTLLRIDAFVMKLSRRDHLAIYLRGSFEDQGVGIAVDAFGHAYVAGNTLE